jgi:hypothetical protein
MKISVEGGLNNQLRRLRSILAGVTYKPSFSIEAESVEGRTSEICLMVSMRAPDVETGNETVVFRVKSIWDFELADMSDLSIVENCILSIIRDMEEHEMREWLKYKGICVRNPHPQEVAA